MLANSTYEHIQPSALPTELTHVTADTGNAHCCCSCFVVVEVVGKTAGS